MSGQCRKNTEKELDENRSLETGVSMQNFQIVQNAPTIVASFDFTYVTFTQSCAHTIV